MAVTFIYNEAKSQSVGIGTTTPNTSAMLDITSTNKGLLIPRIALTATNSPSPLSGFVAGMMVYNTASAGTPPNNVTPGFYLCNGTLWERPIGGSSGGWSLTGNSGTNSSINFIGTTDNQDLIFKRNNIKAGIINESLANTGFGLYALNQTNTGSANTAIGGAALYNNTSGDGNIGLGYQSLLANTLGDGNIGIGYLALGSSKAGSNGIAIGSGAMASYNNTLTPFENTNIAIGASALEGSSNEANNTGLDNVVIGTESMKKNTSGSGNNTLGSIALGNNTTGSGNIAIGSGALFTNISGNNNTAIGGDAGYSSVGNGNVFIGSHAGSNEIGNNKLYIHNTNGDANTALLYGEFDNKMIRLNGRSENIFNVTFNDTPAVYGENDNTDFYGVGVHGKGGWKGVEGIVAGTGPSLYYGVYGQSIATNTGSNFGVYGVASSATNNYGVYGAANGVNSYAGYFEGAVAIGDATPIKATGYMLSVDGKIACTEVRVQPSNLWPDYVFSPSYELLPISELEKSIKENCHLPGIPSVKVVETEGISLGEMQRKMMEKIEELTLYIIDLNQEIKDLKNENAKQAIEINKLKRQ